MRIIIFVPFIIGLVQTAAPCPIGKFWSSYLEACLSCSKCTNGQITVRPCQPHRDTECDPISDLEIDWSFLPKASHKQSHENFIEHNNNKHHGNNKKLRKHFHFNGDGDDYNDNDDDDLYDLEDMLVNRKRGKNKNQRKSKHKEHNWKDFNVKTTEKTLRKLPRRPKIDDLWLMDSDNDRKIKLNHPTRRIDPDLFDDIVKHELHNSNKNRRKQKKFTGTDEDIEIFRELLNEEKKRESDFVKLLKKDSVNIKSLIPTHRMFLGEPSTVSEIIGQVKDPQEVIKEEFGSNKNVILEKSKLSLLSLLEDDKTLRTSKNNLKYANDYNSERDDDEVIAVPFTTAETLVWDWQAVAIMSAVAACLLFFVSVAIYILINVNNWKIGGKLDHKQDPEEALTRMSLMPSNFENSVHECKNTNCYLDKLIATKYSTDNDDSCYSKTTSQ